MTYQFAVMGSPIDHSLSPVIHRCFADQFNIPLDYKKIKTNEDFEQQVSNFFSQGGKGLNVTLPLKERAFALAHKSTARCQLAGAANTLWMDEQVVHADNTDGVGLVRDLARYLPLHDKRILVLGAGGAARGILAPLLEQQPRSLMCANRTLSKAQALQLIFPEIQCSDLDSLSGDFDLIVNATSASIDHELVNLPQHCLQKKTWCYDLAYQLHQPTAFVRYTQKMGCEAVDGLGMLVEQAAEAFAIWHGVVPDTQTVLQYLRDTN